MERDDRNMLRWLVVGALTFTLVIGGMCLGLWQIHDVVSGHNAELGQIKTLSEKISNEQTADSKTKAQEAKDIKAVRGFASSILGKQSTTGADLMALCDAVHADCPPVGAP
jgi:hypothetical protein